MKAKQASLRGDLPVPITPYYHPEAASRGISQISGRRSQDLWPCFSSGRLLCRSAPRNAESLTPAIWSPDGRSVVLDGTQIGLKLYNIDTGELTTLVTEGIAIGTITLP
jgi:hypothetical protein